MTYEAMTPPYGRSVVHVLVVRVLIYEAMPPSPQCGMSAIQVLVVREYIGVVTYEAITPQGGSGLDYQGGYTSCDDTPVWEVSGSGSAVQIEYMNGDL